MRVKFNILQKDIVNYQNLYPGGKSFYQKIEINKKIDNKQLYIYLLNKFSILKSII